jgi:hypothetical protein
MGKIWHCNNTMEECHGLKIPYLSSPDDSLVLNLLIGEDMNLQTRHQPQPVHNYCNTSRCYKEKQHQSER